MKLIIVLFFLFIPLFLWGQEKVSEQNSVTRKEESPVPREDSWFGKDKVFHFVGSFLLVGAGSCWHNQHYDHNRGQSIRFGMAFSVSLGLAKEIWDKHRPRGTFSWKDLVVDLLGVFLCSMLLELL